MSRTVILFRHGIAEDAREGLEDAERRLTTRGRRRTRVAAAGLRRLVGGSVVVWSSPLLRALETADEVARAWGDRSTVRIVDELHPETTPEDLAALLLRPVDDQIVAVGHEPLLSSTAASMTGVAPLPALGKCGCAGLRIEGENRVSLSFLLTPRLLRRAAR